jgi:hypothetical protein
MRQRLCSIDSGSLTLHRGPIVVFYLLGAMALGSLVSVLAIPANAVDCDLTRGLDDAVPGKTKAREDANPPGLQVLVSYRSLLIFAVCALLFHLANAAMLPLVDQKLALQDKNLGMSLMAASIVAAMMGKITPEIPAPIPSRSCTLTSQ